MQIISEGIENGIIEEKYGKKGNVNLSIPLKFIDYPVNTISFAIIVEDYDAIPVCGYDFIHWLVYTKEDDLKENASLINKNIIQGQNSLGDSHYYGMAPPDRPHYYDITVFALDCELNLKNNFTYDELLLKIENHILDKENIKGLYNN